MRYKFDHDLHIHTYLSECSSDPAQNKERILQYAKENKLHTVCVTDHMWDSALPGASDWYRPQDFKHISEIKPLPAEKGIRFLFGCEAEVDKNFRFGVSEAIMDEFDFIVLPTTHLHMIDFTITKEDSLSVEGIARVWKEKLDAVLDMKLPFYKMGLAHLTCSTMPGGKNTVPLVMEAISQEDKERLLTKAAEKGLPVELNSDDMEFMLSYGGIIKSFYETAKGCGCKFYLGSDAHSPCALENAPEIFERTIDALKLEEKDKAAFVSL